MDRYIGNSEVIILNGSTYLREAALYGKLCDKINYINFIDIWDNAVAELKEEMFAELLEYIPNEPKSSKQTGT